MKRRDFIKKAGLASAGSLLLSQIPVKLLAGNNLFNQLSFDNDRVLVLIQLHGGNDGLNTLVPLDQYALYEQYRSNIALPQRGVIRTIQELDMTLPSSRQLGLHPNLMGLKSMYDEGMMSVVQSVGYPDMSMSHYKSQNQWFKGFEVDHHKNWVDEYMQTIHAQKTGVIDPLSLEFGRDISPIIRSVKNNSISSPELIENNLYANHLSKIRELEKVAHQAQYEQVQNAYIIGANHSSVQYPGKENAKLPKETTSNPLSEQLQMISRLISGGLKTKVYIAKMGGFDTHEMQVAANDPTKGTHAALLSHFSETINAFYKDLKNQGLADNVLTTCFSEFGRSVASNVKYGTDHGTAGPMFLFGSQINAGVIGTNADLSNLENGELKVQYDYRQVVRSVVEDWMMISGKSQFDLKASTPKINLMSNSYS